MSIPNQVGEILRKKTFVHLTTLMPDGSPHSSPVWCDFDGSFIIVNSAKGRVKDRNMRKDSRVALSAVDPDNPYRAIMIRGKVVDITEQGADELIDRLAKKYMGVDKYPYRAAGEVRVVYKIEPLNVATMG
jgi:PPOX class probable F420-dependent enzyme